MALGQDAFAPVRLSLGELPEGDRAAVFREVIGRQVVKWDLTPAPDAPLAADLEWVRLPSIEIISGTIGPTVIRRTAELIADGNDGFSLSISLGGRWRMTGRSRELDDRSSAAGFAALGEPLTVESPWSSRFLVLQIARASLAGQIANLDDAVMKPIAADAPPLRLLKHYLRAIGDGRDLNSSALRVTAAMHLRDLVCLAVGGVVDDAHTARRPGVAAARLAMIKRDVEANLAFGDLSADYVARRHAMSVRALQRLFERDGSTFSAFVRQRRLARTHGILSDPAARGRSVADIAFGCGFGDVSHFNRMFRRAYGAAPSDVRARGSDGGGE